MIANKWITIFLYAVIIISAAQINMKEFAIHEPILRISVGFIVGILSLLVSFGYLKKGVENED